MPEPPSVPLGAWVRTERVLVEPVSDIIETNDGLTTTQAIELVKATLIGLESLRAMGIEQPGQPGRLV